MTVSSLKDGLCGSVIWFQGLCDGGLHFTKAYMSCKDDILLLQYEQPLCSSTFMFSVQCLTQSVSYRKNIMYWLW